MSDRMTSIHIRNNQSSRGLAEYGRKNRAEMISAYREYAETQKQEAERILSARDEDFVVHTYLGVHVERNKEEVTS